MPPESGQGRPLMIAGVVTEITSYSKARGHVLVTQGYTGLVTYGSLVEIEDSEDPSKHYLAVVSDVRERGILPSIDQKALEKMFQSMIDRGVEPKRVNEVLRVLRELVFPGVQRQYGLREVDLKILGEIRRDKKGRLTLEFHERPPRPYSGIREAGSSLLNSLMARECRYIVLGEHHVVGGALATLDPEALRTHLAIVGQTGSGKTETVKRVALEYYARRIAEDEAVTLIVFDVAGEYIGYPYKPPEGSKAVPLLDALLKPESYVCEPRRECGGLKLRRPERLTIVVPYAVTRIGLRKAQEEAYMKTYKPLLERLEEALKELGGKAEEGRCQAILFGRNHVYTLDENSGLKRISLYEAWVRLRDTKNLVIALPLPDALSIDEIVALSGTRSEYAPALIRSAADRLGILEGDLVAGLTLLADVLELYRRGVNLGSFAKNLLNKVEGLISKGRPLDFAAMLSILKNAWLEASGAGKEGESEEFPFFHVDAWRYYLTLPLWQGWIDFEKPFDYGLPETVKASLGADDPVYKKAWSDSIKARLGDLENNLESWSSATLGAAFNAVHKLSFTVSPLLNYEIYREVVGRILGEGVAFVLLAPPSTGAAELPVARIIDETFNWAVATYDPSKRRRILLVLEEAHNLAPAKKEPPTKSGVLRIAREGRKWGIGLVLVTQRPGFVDPDVLSQAATLIALRTTNPEDIASLRRSVESVTSELAERLPDLEPGQAIVSGLAVPERRVPLLARIAMLGSHQEICGSGPQQGPP